MQTSALYLLSVVEAADLLRRREISALELTRAVLDRIDEVEQQINAYITVTREAALDQAASADRELRGGDWRGQLHGIPIALKDLFDTADVRTTAGSSILRERIPNHDATVVRRLKDVGAILLGKLNLHEFAYGVTTINPHFGPTRNPWKLDRVPGGSSGGSAAAIAAGECLASLGTDTGGSVRIPAAYCNVVGLKPTYGRVSRAGVVPLSWSLDHVGPMTRNVRDTAILLNAIAGYDPADPSSARMDREDFTADLEQRLSGIRVGIPRDYFSNVVSAEVAQAVQRAGETLKSAGAELIDFDLPFVASLPTISSAIMMPEASANHVKDLQEHRAEIGDDVRMRLELGLVEPAVQYVRAQQARRLVQEACLQSMESLDVFLTATTPTTAPLIDAQATGLPSVGTRLTAPINVLGWPAISIPCGFGSDGLPIGMQLVAKPWQERVLLRAAFAYESLTSWHKSFPSLAPAGQPPP